MTKATQKPQTSRELARRLAQKRALLEQLQQATRAKAEEYNRLEQGLAAAAIEVDEGTGTPARVTSLRRDLDERLRQYSVSILKIETLEQQIATLETDLAQAEQAEAAAALQVEVKTLETLSTSIDVTLGQVATAALAWMAQLSAVEAMSGQSTARRPGDSFGEALYRSLRHIPAMEHALRTLSTIPSQARSCTDFCRRAAVRAERQTPARVETVEKAG
jgi:hypothetical protein